MLVLIRWVSRLFKKEYRFLARYERSHPHFFWYLALDAVISTLVVVGGFQLYSHVNSTSPTDDQLERAGAVQMTANQFINNVKLSGATVYWLGPLYGATYSLNRSLKYAIIVTYISQGSNFNDASKSRLTVETYANSTALSHDDRLLASAPGRKVVTEKGVTIEYDANTLTAMAVTLQGVQEAVIVEYPSKQSESQLLKDAGKLVLVK